MRVTQLFGSLFFVDEIDVVDREQVPTRKKHVADVRGLVRNVAKVHAHGPEADNPADGTGHFDIGDVRAEAAFESSRNDETEPDAVSVVQFGRLSGDMRCQPIGEFAQADMAVSYFEQFDGYFSLGFRSRAGLKERIKVGIIRL